VAAKPKTMIGLHDHRGELHKTGARNRGKPSEDFVEKEGLGTLRKCERKKARRWRIEAINGPGGGRGLIFKKTTKLAVCGRGLDNNKPRDRKVWAGGKYLSQAIRRRVNLRMSCLKRGKDLRGNNREEDGVVRSQRRCQKARKCWEPGGEKGRRAFVWGWGLGKKPRSGKSQLTSSSQTKEGRDVEA